MVQIAAQRSGLGGELAGAEANLWRHPSLGVDHSPHPEYHPRQGIGRLQNCSWQSNGQIEQENGANEIVQHTGNCNRGPFCLFV